MFVCNTSIARFEVVFVVIWKDFHSEFDTNKTGACFGCGGGGGGFTRPIPRDGGADQFRGIPIVGRLPTDGTRGPEEKGCGRKWPDAEGLVQGSRARDVRDPVIQNHSCCKKESRLDQPCGDKS